MDLVDENLTILTEKKDIHFCSANILKVLVDNTLLLCLTDRPNLVLEREGELWIGAIESLEVHLPRKLVKFKSVFQQENVAFEGANEVD